VSIDLERQIAVYSEHLERLAPPVEPDVESLVPVIRRRSYLKGIAVATGVAVLVLLVLGSLLLLLDPADQAPPATAPQSPVPPTSVDPVVPPPASTMPLESSATTSAPVREGEFVPPEAMPIDGFTIEEVPVDGEVFDLEVGLDGTVWALRHAVDPSGWNLVRRVAGDWEIVAVGRGSPLADLNTEYGAGFASPQILGVRPDGGIWIHEEWVMEGPFFLWEYRDDEWIDHTQDAHLPGDSDTRVSLDCCPMAIDDAGAVWVRSEVPVADTDLTETVVSRYDGEWELIDQLEGGASVDALLVELGAPPALRWINSPFPAGLQAHGVKWVLDHDWGRTGTWTITTDDTVAQEFPVDWDTLQSSLTCNWIGGVFDQETESVIASDGALWTIWPCIGVTRIDPTDGSMTLFVDQIPDSSTRIAITPNDTVWVGGSQGIAVISPSSARS
jgi:hypothetical protein